MDTTTGRVRIQDIPSTRSIARSGRLLELARIRRSRGWSLRWFPGCRAIQGYNGNGGRWDSGRWRQMAHQYAPGLEYRTSSARAKPWRIGTSSGPESLFLLIQPTTSGIVQYEMTRRRQSYERPIVELPVGTMLEIPLPEKSSEAGYGGQHSSTTWFGVVESMIYANKWAKQ